MGGIEAEKVKSMVEQTAQKEYEAEVVYRAMMKKLFSKGETLSHPAFYQWLKLIEEIAVIATLSERQRMSRLMLL